ncbi:Ku protein [Streptomyces narbonensis]|uniref:Non-homologous end joining protein Ku n=1 Tax=Streptomyces narbonensis TaxID=67333 RepID=A0ABV3CC11_9ACTN
MARPVWTGVVSFGLVSLPIALYTATDSHTIRFHQLQRGTADRIRNRRVNERTGDEVDSDEIVKGFDTGGEYVIVEPKELDDIAPGRSKALDVSEFVDLDTVEPIFFDRTYYLGPRGEQYGKVYALLQRALAESNKAGIATFVMRGREYLVALKAEDDLLTLHTLHWADEIRDPHKEVPDLPGRTEPTASEVKMAHQLIDALTTDWIPEDFHDTFQEKVKALIKAKAAGETTEKAEPAAQPTGVVDLMEALRSSVERARSPKDTGEKKAVTSRASAKTAGKKPAAKKRATSSSGRPRSPSLRSLTKVELYEKATKAGIRGRSNMNHDELADALTRAKAG